MPQTYRDHRVFPAVHLLAGSAIIVEMGRQGYLAITSGDLTHVWMAVVWAALLIVWQQSRRKAQVMQDRIIRLEMQVRLRQVLPAEAHAGIDRLTLSQLVALRFASDAELPGLVQRTLSGEFASANAIKQAVKDWQGDDLRV